MKETKKLVLPIVIVIVVAIIIIVSVVLIVGGKKNNDTQGKGTSTSGTSTSKNSGDINKQYEKIRQDFIKIKDGVSLEKIKDITGITPTTIKDGVESYGYAQYEYKFDYGFDYEAYITLRYSHNPKSIYPNESYTVELKCPDELFENDKLDLSSVTKESFKADVDKGIKVSAINKLAKGEGFAKEYQTSSKTGKVDTTNMVWADKKGNYISSSLRGDETVELKDKTLSLVRYILEQ